MAHSSRSTENAQRMLRDLMAAEALAASLNATAPLAVRSIFARSSSRKLLIQSRISLRPTK